MIKKIVIFVLPLFAIVALFLKINGVDHIEFGKEYYDFMLSVLQRSETFTFAIPEIPPIPTIDNGFLDALIGFINGLSSVINILTTILNVLIKVLAFILGLIKSAIEGLKDLIPTTSAVLFSL